MSGRVIGFVAAGVAGAAVGYFGGKAIVKRLPDEFSVLGVHFKRKVKEQQPQLNAEQQ